MRSASMAPRGLERAVGVERAEASIPHDPSRTRLTALLADNVIVSAVVLA